MLCQKCIGLAEGPAAEKIPWMRTRDLGEAPPGLNAWDCSALPSWPWAGRPHKINTMGLSCWLRMPMAASVNFSHPMSRWELAWWALTVSTVFNSMTPGQPTFSDNRYSVYNTPNRREAPGKCSPVRAEYPHPALLKNTGHGPDHNCGKGPAPESPPLRLPAV